MKLKRVSIDVLMPSSDRRNVVLPSWFHETKCLILSAAGAITVLIIIILFVILTPTPNPSDVRNTPTPPVLELFEVSKASKIFPKWFLFGLSSAAYQIEGGWNAHGKGPSIWDTFTHRYPEKMADRSNGDISTNCYENYETDIDMLKQIGVDFYRFSISWSRVLADGSIDSINEAGLRHYDQLIDRLIAQNITPMVTMFHFDLPQRLQDFGGWLNPRIVDYFADYADLLFSRYGDRVKYWITINEPVLFCTFGYGIGIFPPSINWTGTGDYLCGHYSLLAHAKAYHLYHQKYAAKYGGLVGVALDIDYTWPKDSSKREDRQAAERYLQFKFGWLANPIYGEQGDYPALMKDIIGRNSKEEGRSRSRLPEFTANEISLIKGSSDFLGLNYYSSSFTEPASDTTIFPNPSYDRDLNISVSYDPSWPRAKSTWLYSVPRGFRDILGWIKRNYNNPKVIVTENGWSDDGDIRDTDRSNYIKQHLNAVIEALLFDECNVIGYTYCGLLDNFEWIQGYTEKFGIIQVDFDSATRERRLKHSANIFAEIINTRKIPKSYPTDKDVFGQFPLSFKFGSATSAYQVEGAWNKEGKGPNIWDTLTQTQKNYIKDRSNGNIAANSYDLYKEDVKAAKTIGLNFYRFSISWSRVMPDGDMSSVNELGLKYYDRLIDELQRNEIEPIVTMYHWDLPQTLQDLGGWTNPIIVKYFEDYAKLLFDRYANRVKTWITFNEPYNFCLSGYGNGTKAPMISSRGIGVYLCGHHVLLAHAHVYDLYRRKYFSFDGKMSMALDIQYFWPENPNSQVNVEAANRTTQFVIGWFLNPIFGKNGNYPSVMRDTIDRNSLDQGFEKSRLPTFTQHEIKMLKGSFDFLGANYYLSKYVDVANSTDFHVPSFEHDTRANAIIEWSSNFSSPNYTQHDGLREALNWIKREYLNPQVILMENGISIDEPIDDQQRIDHIRNHLQVILDTIWVDQCYVTGYTYWSLIDGFEWMEGYTKKYGLYHIDYDSPDRTRSPKRSSHFYNSIITTRQLPNVMP